MTATVADQSAVVAAMAKPWPMIDALVGGTGAMRDAGKAFLPQFPSEPDDAYKARLSQATLFPAFSRTADVMAGKPLSKEIHVDGIPPEIEGLLENVDGEGATLHAFASTLMQACLQYGIGGVLVDNPPAEGIRTKAEEEEYGVRPYFATYAAKAILGWRQTGHVINQLRLLEMVTEPDGAFGDTTIQQVRVLTPGAWQIWRSVKGADGREVWMIHEEGATTLKKIPFVFFYGIRKGLGIGKPPLLDLAYLNVEHWQSSSDQQTILHTARVPILFGAGFPDDAEITIGASTFTRSTSPDATLTYTEHSGAAIAAGRQSLLDLEDRMRQTGAELLVQQPMQTTATQTVSEGEGSRSILQRIVENFEESLEECIELLGAWRGLNFDAEVTMFKDFGATTLSDQSSNTLISAGDKGYVSPETVFTGLQRSDIVPPGVKWEDEQEKIAASKKAKAAMAPKTPPVQSPSEQGTPEDNIQDGLNTTD